MRTILSIAAICLLISVASCVTPSDSTIEPPPELITHVLLTLKDSANMQDSVVARFSDLDGPTGPEQPVITGVTLKGGRTYYGSIRFLEVRQDRVDSLIEVTDEVHELSTQHQVFYLLSNNLQLVMMMKTSDIDANGLPLGLATIARTNENPSHFPQVGSVNVTLSHFEQPGSKNGKDRSDESDVDIVFPVTIE